MRPTSAIFWFSICGLVSLFATLISVYLIEATLTIFICFLVLLLSFVFSLFVFLISKSRRGKILTLTFVSTFLFIALVLSHLPLRIAFHFYSNDFDKVAQEIKDGKKHNSPFWIGPFYIKMTGAGKNNLGGTPYLACNTEKWEIEGFVNNPEGLGFNLWSCIKLNENWSYIAED